MAKLMVGFRILPDGKKIFDDSNIVEVSSIDAPLEADLIRVGMTVLSGIDYISRIADKFDILVRKAD